MRHRVHNFLADHLRTVQYPRENDFTVNRAPLRWKHDMPITKRIGIAVFSLFWIIVFSALIIVMGIIGWAFIGAALGIH